MLNNLLPVAVSFFALGIGFAVAESKENVAIWVAAIGVGALALVGLRFRAEKTGRLVATLALLLFLFLVGLIHVTPHLNPPVGPEHLVNQIHGRQTVTLIGNLAKIPARLTDTDGKPATRLLISTELFLLPDTTGGADAISQFRTTTGLVQLTFLAPPPADLSPGDRFMVKARISQPHGYATPGVFDYGKYLGHQSIWLTGLVDSPVDIMRLQTDNPDSWFKPSVSYRYLPERLRHRVATFLDQNLDNPVRGLYKAVLIGDQSEVPEEVLDNFKATGAMHVLAISGMHIGLLVLLFYAIFIRLLKRSTWLILHIPVPKVAAGLTLMPVTAYALIAGCNPPVLRALFMATVVLIAILFDRQKALLTNIALAALVLLVWQPTSLYTASFQLSFGAVIAIAIFFDNIVGRFLDRQQQSSAITRLPASVRKTVNWMLAGLLFSLAIMTAIAPLLVYHFNQIALIGPITTLLVEPLLCLWSLLIGLAAIVIQPLLPGLAVLLLVQTGCIFSPPDAPAVHAGGATNRGASFVLTES